MRIACADVVILIRLTRVLTALGIVFPRYETVFKAEKYSQMVRVCIRLRI